MLTKLEQSYIIQMAWLEKNEPALYAKLASKEQSLNGLFEDGNLDGFKKKLQKALKKINPVRLLAKVTIPAKTRDKMAKFEKKHRADIKKVGAAVAIAAGGWAFSPQILAGAKAAGGALKLAGAKVASALQAGGHKIAETAADGLNKILPDGEKVLGDKVYQSMIDKIESVGKDTIMNAVAQKFTNNAPILGADDPRITDIATDIVNTQAFGGGFVNDSVAFDAATRSAMIDNQSEAEDGEPVSAGGNNKALLIGGAAVAALLLMK